MTQTAADANLTEKSILRAPYRLVKWRVTIINRYMNVFTTMYKLPNAVELKAINIPLRLQT